MSGRSIGSIIGGIAGAIVGFFAGGNVFLGASIGMTLGGALGGFLDPEKGPHSQGPRLSDLSQQTSTYGAVIPRIYGAAGIYGNVFWLENNVLKEVETNSGGGKGMPSGPTQTTYTYYGTFAVGLCEGPVTEVKRIWFSGKLWYNAGSADVGTIQQSDDKKTKFKVYYGNEDQLPEPRMQADVGAASCPAYRGLAYIVFYDIEMTDYGNTLAGLQVKVEVVKSGSYSAYIETSPGWAHDFLDLGYACVHDGKDLFHTSGHTYFRFDVSKPGQNRFGAFNNSTQHKLPLLFKREDYLYAFRSQVAEIEVIASLSGGLFLNGIVSLDGAAMGGTYKDDKLYVVTTGSVRVYNMFTLGILALAGSLSNPLSLAAASCAFYNGRLFVGTNRTLQIFDVSDLTSPVLLAQGTLAMAGNATYQSSIHNGRLYVLTSYGVEVFDANLSVVAKLGDVAIAGGERGLHVKDELLIVSIQDSVLIYDIFKTPNSPTLLSSHSITFLKPGSLNGQIAEHEGYYYFPIAYDGPGVPTDIDVEKYAVMFIGKTVSSAGVELKDIVLSECINSKLLASADVDVSQLTQQVKGYRVGNVAAIRAAIDPLQACWPFDVIQDGYKIKFVKRGNAGVSTISSDKLAARPYGDSSLIKLTKVREMDSILPAKVNVNYLDYSREYDAGQQYYERINTDAVNVTNLELSVVMTAAEAYGKAQSLCYLYWLERHDLSFSLPPEYLYLQPADVITITAPGETYQVRIKQINYTSSGQLEITGKLNNPAIYIPTEITDEGPSPVETLARVGATEFELLDIPTLQDSLDRPGYYLAMAGTTNGWPGGSLLRSDDGGQSYSLVQAVAKPGAVFGTAVNVIGANKGAVIDKSAELIVDLIRGELESVTELAMLNGANHFAYGVNGRYEIMAAQNCVLQADGTYKVYGLIRGRLGTEQYTGAHAAGDNVVLLTASNIRFLNSSSNLIGQERLFKGINAGATLDSSIASSFLYQGVNLECLSPVYAKGYRDLVTNNWILTFMRRTRIGYEWRDLVDASLGESVESYEIDIYSDDTYTQIKRTLSSNSENFVYTHANLIEDFGDDTLGDSNYNFRVLGLHCSGTNNSTAFIDNSPSSESVSANGDAKISTAVADPFGGSAGVAVFDGNSDYLTIPQTNSDYNLGPNDFSLDLWYYPISANTSDRILQTRNGDVVPGIYLAHNSATQLQFFYSDNGTSFQGSGISFNVTQNQWNYIQIRKTSGTVRAYLAATQQGADYSVTGAAYYNSSHVMVIGGQAPNGASALGRTIVGRLADIRIMKADPGVLPVPTARFPDFITVTKTELNVKIYQKSASVGRGYPLTATIFK